MLPIISQVRNEASNHWFSQCIYSICSPIHHHANHRIHRLTIIHIWFFHLFHLLLHHFHSWFSCWLWIKHLILLLLILLKYWISQSVIFWFSFFYHPLIFLLAFYWFDLIICLHALVLLLTLIICYLFFIFVLLAIAIYHISHQHWKIWFQYCLGKCSNWFGCCQLLIPVSVSFSISLLLFHGLIWIITVDIVVDCLHHMHDLLSLLLHHILLILIWIFNIAAFIIAAN